MQAQQQRDSVNHCINSLSPYGYKTTICKEGPKALARLLELEIAQKTHPAQHKNIMQTILSIAQTPQHNLTLGSVEEQSPGSWLPLAGSAHDMTYDGLGFPANMSNVLPGIMNLDESSNIDWVLDTTMLFNMS